jgi:hypothetical protein
LSQADTKDADVAYDILGRMIWLSGAFLGGAFLGGEFWGGEFRGGVFRGGAFLGGEFWGGEFQGGEFLGGEFRGGEFLGGEVRGHRVTWLHTLTNCEGYPKTLCAVDGVAWILAGCQWFTLADAKLHWAERSDRPLTRAAMLMASEVARQQGLRESAEVVK